MKPILMCNDCPGDGISPVSGQTYVTGKTTARVMFIGEAPGYDEMLVGEPFVGPSGKVLREAILNAKIVTYHITNVVKCGQPRNVLNLYCVQYCYPLLDWEISTIRPHLIILLGNTAVSAVLGKRGVTKLRRKPFMYREEILTFCTLHPSTVVRGTFPIGEFRDDIKYYHAMMGLRNLGHELEKLVLVSG